MILEGINVVDVLLKGNYVSPEEITEAQQHSQSHHTTVLEFLLEKGTLTKELLGQAIAENFGITFADLAKAPLSREEVLKIPQEVGEKHHLAVLKEDSDSVLVATDNPTNIDIEQIIAAIFPGKRIVLAYAFYEDLKEAFIHYKQSLEARFIQIITGKNKVAPEILDQIFSDALVYRASDIHFEPRGEEVYTRFRIDGVLHDVGKLPRFYYENILNRIKVQAQLKIDEHFSSQDGALRFVKDGNVLDARISIVPTTSGEKVVMRLLSEYVRSLSLADLGLSEQDYNQISASAKKPFGMILVTGPTGSGKTTTLYALLKMLNHPEINITTIEDPVEYRVSTMNQIQVNAQTNLTFSQGLRSILRQDPDIILVGEIRDKDTVEVATNAALTGHLLFSTFHANDAATAVPRLLDMGVEPYQVASTLELIVAQRLLRRICENCRYSITLSPEQITQILPSAEKYLPQSTKTFYKGKGCPVCNNTGYKGRVGIFELMTVTKDLQDLIVKSPSSRQVWELARKQGLKTLFEDGIEKVKQGLTTLEELVRVAPPQS